MAAQEGLKWLCLGVAAESATDPSSLPLVADEYQVAATDMKFGPWSNRISPGRVSSRSSKDSTVMVSAKLADGAKPVTKDFKVEEEKLLPWDEGFLVLEFLQRQEIAPAWCQPLMIALEKYRQKKEKDGGELSSAAYVESRLLDTSVTGRAYEDSEGQMHHHRRTPMRPWQVPADGKEGDGLFKVKEVLAYLPPWEAWLHPKCRLYQDFFKVLWASPYEQTEYGDTENGVEGEPGTTWEPDECLPDSLDALRVEAKRRWVVQQREKEQARQKGSGNLRVVPKFVTAPPIPQQRQSASSSSAPVARPKPSAKPSAAPLAKGSPPAAGMPLEPPLKRPRLNPLGVHLEQDLAQPAISHGWAKQLVADPESSIKEGWPKADGEYPKGHGPAKPPGACSADCTCMEDWHLGNAIDRSWIDGDTTRVQSAEASVQSFATSVRTRKRGEVSGQHFFECLDEKIMRTFSQVECWKICRVIEDNMRTLADKLPAEALEGGGTMLLQQLALIAFVKVDKDWGSVAPLQYVLESGPSGLHVDAATGKAAAQKPLSPAKVKMELQHFTREAERMDFEIIAGAAVLGEDQRQCTQMVVTIWQRLAEHKGERSLRDILKEHLDKLYDFEQHQCIEVMVPDWVATMFQVYLLARTASACNLLPRTQAEPPVWKDLGPSELTL
mmetsp:Transcript_27428/g.63376  ORF Transcript_27428/g.63376 Transcript_27428/m.63376 type:complete len:668 (-) Transcript_27428:81-2084(-)